MHLKKYQLEIYKMFGSNFQVGCVFLLLYKLYIIDS